jgi:hypothetical protein
MEFRHHFPGEQFERVADRLVGGLAGLVEQDDLVDARLGELTQLAAQRFGRADKRVVERGLRLVAVAPTLIGAPQVALARRIDAGAAVVAEREDEEGPAAMLQDELQPDLLILGYTNHV